MKNRNLTLLYSLCFTILFSCKNGQLRTSEDYLNKAKTFFNQKEFQNSKLYIDSIQIKFPKDFDNIKSGMVLLKEVRYAEQKRTFSFCDSTLKAKTKELPQYTKDFIFTKNEKYESIGYYIPKELTIEKNVNKTFLQPKVSEKGNLILTSYYYGLSRPKHTFLKAENKEDFFCRTLQVPIDGAMNYSFKESNTYHEIVRFNSSAQNNIIPFIIQNKRIKILLNGEKRYSYYLPQSSRLAMIKAQTLSTLLKDITKLKEEKALAETKLKYLQGQLDSIKKDSLINKKDI